jgi:hypothetical protein
MALCLSARRFGACSPFQASVKDLPLAESPRRLALVHLGRQLRHYACGTNFKLGSMGFDSWSRAQTIRARKAVVQAVATGEITDIEAEVGALFLTSQCCVRCLALERRS